MTRPGEDIDPWAALAAELEALIAARRRQSLSALGLDSRRVHQNEVTTFQIALSLVEKYRTDTKGHR